MAVKLGVAGLASLAVAGLVTLMVTWWSSPLDTVSASPFAAFDQRDLIPIGWTAFTFAAGVTAGVLIRRTLPAMAAALAVFAAVRAVINKLVRPHLSTPPADQRARHPAHRHWARIRCGRSPQLARLGAIGPDH
jgi:hypothetical protein